MKKGTGIGASTELGQSSSAKSARESRKPPPDGTNVCRVLQYTKIEQLDKAYNETRFTIFNLQCPNYQKTPLFVFYFRGTTETMTKKV